MNTKKIIIEEINKSLLLMNYNTNKTLAENVITNNILISEQPLQTFVKNLFGVSDDVAKKANMVKLADADFIALPKYNTARQLLDDRIIYTTAGFTNVDELLNAIKAGTVDTSKLAKGLLKTGNVSGKLKNSLINKAADLMAKDVRYLTSGSDDIVKTLKAKGYNNDIAEEIAKKFVKKRDNIISKTGATPKDMSDIGKITFPTSIKNWNWTKIKNWGLGLGLSAAAIATIWYFFNTDSTPNSGSTVTDQSIRYTDCTGRYKLYCKSAVIKQVQNCLLQKGANLGRTGADGKLGPVTDTELKRLYTPYATNGFFTDDEVQKICSSTPTQTIPTPTQTIQPTPEDFGTSAVDISQTGGVETTYVNFDDV